jgi:hypothetical protein
VGSSGVARFTAGMDEYGNGAAAAGGVETLSRAGLASTTGSSGRLWINYVTAPITTTISQLTVCSGDTAAVSCTLARMCVFTVAGDGSVTLAARTASQTTIGAATFTSYQFPLNTTGGFPATYTLEAGLRYGFGFLQVAGTPMSISGMFLTDSGAAPVPCRVIAGQSDISTSYAVGTLTTQFTECYMAARP